MKAILSFIFLLIIGNLFAQNYAPFNHQRPKRFFNETNVLDNDYFFFSIQTDTLVDTIRFHQYFRETPEVVDVTGTSCQGWGGGMSTVADTTWLGLKMDYLYNLQHFIAWNKQNTPLHFDFSLPIGDSSEFFNAPNVHYFILHQGITTENIYTTSDQVKHFIVKVYDDLNAPVSSNLDGFDLQLGENLGLITFFDVNNFPTIEKKMGLNGQLNPTIGYYQLTYDEVFNWHPGDTLEVKGTANNGQGGVVSHKIYAVNNRIETADSVSLFFTISEQIDSYPPGATSGYNITYPNPLTFAKGENVVKEPNNLFHFVDQYFQDTADVCGLKRTAGSMGTWSMICDSCHCYVPFDGFGYSIYNKTYTEGLGLTYQSVTNYGTPTSAGASLIYSNIGGVPCGDYIGLGIEEFYLNTQKTLIEKVDLLGRPIVNGEKQVVIYRYSDGTTEKVFTFPE